MRSTQAHPRVSTDQKCFNQTHLCVTSLRQREKTRKQKTSSTLVACSGQGRLCTWCQAGSQLDAVFGTVSTPRSATTQMRLGSLGCMDKQISRVHRSSLSRSFEEQFKTSSPGTSRNAQAVLWVAQQRPSGSLSRSRQKKKSANCALLWI